MQRLIKQIDQFSNKIDQAMQDQSSLWKMSRRTRSRINDGWDLIISENDIVQYHLSVKSIKQWCLTSEATQERESMLTANIPKSPKMLQM